ncbi:hypothetical protein B4U80_12420 [Leptotrombidium deliense]|uniref:C-type lectin domain-containing protein n=1 Tax=Leptotrombidium deliense TaxID=299467 RepID=A0A443RTY0_9ACAR|nr:hypothetical protein B4U80_12420 [Leptotrombidium deliense]
MQNGEEEKALEDVRKTLNDLKDIENFKISFKPKNSLKKQRIFEVVQKKMNFEEANKFCEVFGGTMLQIDSEDLNNFIIKNAKEHSSYWIGAIKPIPEAVKMLNLKGQQLSYRPAKVIADDPSSNPSCRRIKDGQWHNTGCRKKANVICELNDKAENPDFNDFKSLIEYLSRAPAKAAHLRRKVDIIQTMVLQQLEKKNEVSEKNADVCYFK